jgi:DNA mismatch repair protein MutS
VLQTFERFKQGAVKDYLTDFPDGVDMNHVEAAILDLVAKLFKDVFLELDDYCTRNRAYLDGIISIFDREAQFYISYLEYIQPLKSAGLHFCYPEISRQSKEIFANETFDVALAQMLAEQGSTVVCNDFYLKEPERIFVVTGPNQGGKTTFARTVGQLHHLASLGCPVPGSASKLFLCDQLFTHFERQEDVAELRGKLEEDLVRIRGILDQATTNSLVIMNEIFTSTTLSDALVLSKKVVARIVELDLLCVYVTFVDEVASLAPSTVSMVSTVVAENPAQRTYKVVRRPADGLSYALAIAQKYDLTYDRLRQRIS